MNAITEPDLISVAVGGSEEQTPQPDISSSYHEIHVFVRPLIQEDIVEDVVDAAIIESRRNEPSECVEVVFKSLGVPME